ncbi:unnamed protein product [Rotaria sp. Silwood2]|nr:unnamed protein product [Rotaria sp. Silwood2]
MTVIRLEDLPNELWLELFVYFTWSELNSTWFQWKFNNRIQMLAEVARNRVALSLSSMSFTTYGKCLHYFEHEHPMIAYRITSLLLNESAVSNEIINRWLENDTSFLPRIRQCTVYIDLVSRSVRANVILLIRRHASILRRIVFYFERVDRYYSILKMIIEQGISLHTMQFIIIGAECATYSHQMFTFPNTVRLRISLQHISDLALLMQYDTLPRIEHLHITMENGIYTSHKLHNEYEDTSCLTLCPKDFNISRASLTHLRTLQLRQVAITNVIVLIQHVKSISQVESLILMNCNVKDKNELIVFKSCITNFMICLCCLHFVLYLPAETKLENIDLYWFNLSHHTVVYEINELMVLYTVPYLLNSQRQVYNHTFGRQSTINNNITHIEWTIDRDPLSINTTLTHFQHVNSLVLFFDIKEMNINLDSWHVLLPFLRHLKLNFDSNPIKFDKLYDRSVTPNHYRCIILEQFRQCASVLEYLTLYWSDIRLLLKHSSSPWPFVRQLNILMESFTNIPSASLMKRLPTNKAFPQLQYLSFGGRRFSLSPPKPLATRILLCFDALVSSSSKFIILHINRCCGTHRSLPFTSRDILLTILTERIRSRSDHYSSSKIIIDSNEEIIIWL